MSMLERLRVMLHLNEAMARLSWRSRQAVILDDDSARFERLGDIEGQTARAQAFAVELDRTVIRP